MKYFIAPATVQLNKGSGDGGSSSTRRQSVAHILNKNFVIFTLSVCYVTALNSW